MFGKSRALDVCFSVASRAIGSSIRLRLLEMLVNFVRGSDLLLVGVVRKTFSELRGPLGSGKLGILTQYFRLIRRLPL